jgi:UDP-N-acetylmuramoyl-tripeptide--D-alanyl-D-alanine ligase
LTAFTVQASGPQALHCDDINTLTQHVMALLPQVGSVLVKGSRFMKMERVLEAITHHAEQHKQETTPCS